MQYILTNFEFCKICKRNKASGEERYRLVRIHGNSDLYFSTKNNSNSNKKTKDQYFYLLLPSLES